MKLVTTERKNLVSQKSTVVEFGNPTKNNKCHRGGELYEYFA